MSRRSPQPEGPITRSVERPYVMQMALGVLAGTGGLLWTRITGLIAVPLLVGALGLKLYGAWSIADLLMTAQGLVDLGALSATAKYVAEADANSNRRAVRRIARMGLLWYTAIGLLVALLLALLLPVLPSWLGMEAGQRQQTQVLFAGAAALFTLSNYAYVMASVLQGMQSLATVHAVTSASRIPYLAIIALTWWRGWGVGGALAATTALYLMQLVLLTIQVSKRTRGEQHHAAPALTYRTFFRFGAKTYVTGICDFLIAQLPRIVAAGFFGAVGAARMDLAYRIPVVAFSFAAPLLTPVVPAAARLVAHRRDADVVELAARVTRYLLAMLLPLLLIVVIWGPALLRAWVGNSAAGLDSTVMILSGAAFLQTAAGAVTAALTGMGQPGRVALYRVAFVLTAVAAEAVGASKGGLTGIAVGAITAGAVATIYLLTWPIVPFGDHRITKLAHEAAGAVASGSAAGAAMAATAAVLGWHRLGTLGLVGLAAYAVALPLFGALRRSDYDTLVAPALRRLARQRGGRAAGARNYDLTGGPPARPGEHHLDGKQ